MQPQVDLRTAGPGAIEDAVIDIKPILEGASEYEYVEILNPLPVDFSAKFGVTRPVRADLRIVTNSNTPTSTMDEADIRRNYGLDLRNKDVIGKANIVNRVTIPSGHTIRVLGNEAQVIVTQLVNEIMQRQKNSLMLADPTQRNIIERQIIKRRNSVESILGRVPVSIQDQLQDAVQQSNVPLEVEFPDTIQEGMQRDEGESTFPTDQRSGGTNTIIGKSDNSSKRPVGRPPKTAIAT